ncbi:MAG: hypothetical protein AB2L14_31580 [Candidatus Xenobiia bacterium LiM19]
MIELKETYQKRFGKETEFRKRMYEVLCKGFFQKYVPENSTVLDLAAGYCEFIMELLT